MAEFGKKGKVQPMFDSSVDVNDNTALHYACCGAKHDTIALLMEKYGAVPVTKRNAHKQLPIHLLFESDDVSDREGIEYVESVYRLIGAHPIELFEEDA